MMTFEAPHYLRYAGLLPLLLAAYALSRYYTARTAWPPAPGRRWLTYARWALPLLVVLALVLALANPLGAGRGGWVRRATQLVLVVDVSNSMLTRDVVPDRLTQARLTLGSIVRQLRSEQVGVVVFAGNAQRYLPLTTDYATVGQACSSITPALLSRQGSSLAEALTLAALVFSPDPPGNRVVCILSDGESHARRDQQVADSLLRAGIHVFAIGVGTAQGGPVWEGVPGSARLRPKLDPQGQPIRSALDAARLRRLVHEQPAGYQQLDDYEVVATRFVQAAQQLPPPAGARRLAAGQPQFRVCLLVALVLLLVELALPSILYARPYAQPD
ncbi:VWA domain-containing protein [Hymenobacter sp. 15J16-1T3B]|uniref:VWA domain-containing protein n=1 Tax=Hymenobacter sp. 15J16-1T3B TaxID=2886941 RepID=UPI001D11FBAA|nr:VWA domain-containing protein [Hymenobacter sp. 15J16-1T3B]MCC3158587.1 VWA domain-containing protein [Hymenobacter sp. 15J16-1T3B]